MDELIFWIVCLIATLIWFAWSVKKYVYDYYIPETVEYF